MVQSRTPWILSTQAFGGEESNDSSNSSEIPDAPNERSEKSLGLLTIRANLRWIINRSKSIIMTWAARVTERSSRLQK